MRPEPGRQTDAEWFVSVAVAVTQLVLHFAGQPQTAATLGVANSLVNRVRRSRPRDGSIVAKGEEIAKEIAAQVPYGDPEYRDITEAEWRAASKDIAALLRGLTRTERVSAGFNAEALRKTLLDGGGRRRRDNLGGESAKAAFDWVLNAACHKVVRYFTEQEALESILDWLEKIENSVRDIRDRQVMGVEVRVVVVGHYEKVRRLAPEKLLGRETELAELRDLIEDGTEQWLAYEAPMLSGKTALMATFAVNPPKNMRVVSYFVRKIEADHGRDDFVFCVRAQLAEILGNPFVGSPQKVEQKYVLDQDLRSAARVCEMNEQILVLLIDGLDEDVYYEDPDATGAASILSALSYTLPPGVIVVTAARPNPPVPHDVLSEACLAVEPKPLRISEHAQASINKKDLDEFFGHRLGRFIGAFLAACGGMLTASDLHDLLDLHDHPGIPLNTSLHDVRSFLQSSPGRLLLPADIGHGDECVKAYELGHDKVSRAILKELKPNFFGEGNDPDDEPSWAKLRNCALASYRQTILKWARKCAAEGGWSSNTPSYLLGDGYLSVVKQEEGELGILDLLAQSGRNDAIVRYFGSGYTIIRAMDETVDGFLAYHEVDLATNQLVAVLNLARERRRISTSHGYLPGLIALRFRYLDESPNIFLGAVLSIDSLSDRVLALTEISNVRGSKRRAEELVDSPYFAEVLRSVRRRPREYCMAKLAEVRLLEHIGYRTKALIAADSALNVLGGMDSSRSLSEMKADFVSSIAKLNCPEEVMELVWQIEVSRSRMRALVAIVEVFAADHRFTDAIKVADEIVDPRFRVVSLTPVARGMAIIGDVDKAIFVFDDALEAAHKVREPRYRAEAFVAVAVVLADVGLTVKAEVVATEALKAAKLLEDPQVRLETLGKVTRELASARLTERALHGARSVRNPRVRSETLAGVAVALAGAGVMVEAENAALDALKTVRRIEDPQARSRVLASVAAALAGVGLTVKAEVAAAEALKAAKLLEDPQVRLETLGKVTRELASARLTERALHGARSVRNPRVRSETLAGVAVALAGAGVMVEAENAALDALKACSRIKDPQTRAKQMVCVGQLLGVAGFDSVVTEMTIKALELSYIIESSRLQRESANEVAEALVDHGHLDEGRLFSRCIGDRELRLGFAVKLTGALANDGRLEDAEKVIRRIRDQRFRVMALVSVVGAYVKVGLSVEATKAADDARRSARRIRDQRFRVTALASVVSAYVSAGLSVKADRTADDALRSARMIENPRSQSEALLAVFKVLLHARRECDDGRIGGKAEEVVDEMLAIARRIHDPIIRAATLVSITRVVGDVGWNEKAVGTAREAERAARKIRNRRFRGEALVGVVAAFLSAGLLVQAKKIAQRIVDPVNRVKALTDVVHAARLVADASAGETVMEALFVAREIQDSQRRTKSIAAVVRVLVSQDGSPTAEAVVADEFDRLRQRHTEDRSDRAGCCIDLARACWNAAEASPKTDQAAIDRWKSLARTGLGMAWMYGAEVWDGFDVLLGVAPYLAMELVHERLLAEGQSQES